MSDVLRKLSRVSLLAEGLAGEGGGDFSAHAEPYRREPLAHYYRMTGSLHDAEDLVQETFLRAWKAYDRFEGKSSVRTWLHRIATNTCLSALEGRQRRPLPTGLATVSSDPTAEMVERSDVPWLEPLPEYPSDPSDPAEIVGSRESVRLAFIAASQHLSPRQRAVLVLRDVSGWKAAEVATAIGTTTAAVNSLLQRARSQLEAVGPSANDRLAPPDSMEAQDRLSRYIAAFEAYDIDRLAELFTSEAIWEMPRYLGWYHGRRRSPPHSPAVPRRGARRYAANPVGRQRPARRRNVYASRQSASTVPAGCAGRQALRGLTRRRILRHHAVREIRAGSVSLIRRMASYGTRKACVKWSTRRLDAHPSAVG